MIVNPAPVKPLVGPEILEQVDIRVGTIVQVADVPRSARLVRLTVDFGDHQRTIIAGLKQERQDPRALEGRQALFVVNLAPRTIMGQVSEGMLFDIGYSDGILPVLAVPESPVPNGARAG
jgi:tRNA-binding protein